MLIDQDSPASAAAGRPAADAPAAGEILQAFGCVRGATEALCEPLATEDYVVQCMADASPVKWHLAHTSWFFEEFALQALPGYRRYDERFGFLFNSYYQAVGAMHARPDRGLLTRPTVAQVYAYREHVDTHVQALLERGAPPQILRVLELGLHHEQQHQELILTDLKALFACNPLQPAYRPALQRAPPTAGAPPLTFHRLAGGLVEVGHDGAGFGFDNETPRHRVWLQPFRIASRLVTNGEYRQFIADGGYDTPALWLSDGWSTVQRERWCRPCYWAQSREQEFTLTGARELDPHAPVAHLSYFEADAFARWAGARLPSEHEWELAASAEPVRGNFVEDGHWHPQPAPARWPLAQLYGDLWEWTQSAYAPYPGYRPPPGALGEYNGKFMVSQLVLRGGSCATPRTHIRASYRNFFYPSARWQFTGLRLAKDDPT